MTTTCQHPIKSDKVSIDMRRVTTMILAGGNGSRLQPLTNTRCKPAVCFGGRYRLIDIPISNAIHSGCSKIFIISQYLSFSLNQHIFNTFHPGLFPSTAIELISAEQNLKENSWFQGTACAIRKNIDYFTESMADYFLILSGDQLYNMNFQNMIRFAKETNADLVVAALPINVDDAKRMGVMKIDENSFVKEFCEKPQTKDALDRFRIPNSTLEDITESKVDGTKEFLGSMGIYVFKRQALLDLLKKDPREDFGKHLVPTKVKEGNVAAYIHNGYWEDIGTIESFFKANIALTGPNPEFNCCFEEDKHIFFRQHYLPSAKIMNSHIQNSIISEGTLVEAAEIQNSIIGIKTKIKGGAIIKNSYVMGGKSVRSDSLHREREDATSSFIGENSRIEHAIIDKNVHIGNDVCLINKNKLKNYDSDKACIRDGIIVVPKGVYLPDGYCL